MRIAVLRPWLSIQFSWFIDGDPCDEHSLAVQALVADRAEVHVLRHDNKQWHEFLTTADVAITFNYGSDSERSAKIIAAKKASYYERKYDRWTDTDIYNELFLFKPT
jgi:hypothetical protein